MATVAEQHEQGMPAAGAALASELFERHARLVYRVCRAAGGSAHDAEDALQQTFLNALRAIQAGARPRNEEAWLVRIARNVSCEQRRAHRRRARLETAVMADGLARAAAVAPEANGDDAACLEGALARLDPRQRTALVLREWRGLSYGEIAGLLRLSQGAAEALVFRARRALARALVDGKRLGRCLDLAGLAGGLRKLLAGGAAKTASAAVIAGSATIVALPALEREAAQPARAPGAREHAPAGAASVVRDRFAALSISPAEPAARRRTPDATTALPRRADAAAAAGRLPAPEVAPLDTRARLSTADGEARDRGVAASADGSAPRPEQVASAPEAARTAEPPALAVESPPGSGPLDVHLQASAGTTSAATSVSASLGDGPTGISATGSGSGAAVSADAGPAGEAGLEASLSGADAGASLDLPGATGDTTVTAALP